jgi:general L-amino acid transport system permease protein
LRIAPASQRNLIQQIVGFASDVRFLRVIGQVVFLILLVIVLTQTWNNIVSSLASRNLTPNFTFLQDRAGFEIGGATDYSPDDPYWSAFMVGVRNTLATVAVGLVGATILGILGGIFLLSTNWLVRNITRFIVEILRNTPLLVQIYVMFFVVVLSLPAMRDSLQIPAEGILPLPLRYLVYLIGLIAVWRAARRYSPAARSAVWAAALALIAVVEICFWLYYNRPEMMRSLYGAGDLSDMRLWVYLAISGAVLLAALFLPRSMRLTVLGLDVGQLLGGLLFYFGVLPTSALRLELQPIFFMNNRGMVFPEVQTTARFAEWFIYVALGIGLALLLFYYLRKQTEQTGQPNPRLPLAIGLVVALSVLGWLIVSGEPTPETVLVEQDGQTVSMPVEEAREQELLTREDELFYSRVPLEVVLPRQQGLRFASGITLTPEYLALTLALIIYTAAFIAEIVRAGILAVPRGQLEAARALGLSYSQLLRMVVLPQALRVIIPPLTNQYLNLAKNSSLAIAISFADVYQVMNTVGNQSGQSVTSIIIVMLTYLVFSLVISAVMNWVNGRFQLVTR